MKLRSRPQPTQSFEDDAGFSLIEVMVATVIAVLAFVGIAYTFSTGRGLINRFEIERAALAAARARLETLASDPGSPDLSITPPPHTAPFLVDGVNRGQEEWTVDWIDDQADGLAGAGDWNPHDLKRVTVHVIYSTTRTATDTVSLVRLVPPS
jgi:prepilin-type N-terminal cleavage/methylation domain-containing protein